MTGDALVDGGPDIAILAGYGDGAFQPPVHLHAGRMSRGVALGDLDADGALDQAVGENQSDSEAVWIFLNQL